MVDFEEDVTEAKDTYTLLNIEINKQQTYGRAKTFFRKYNDIEGLRIKDGATKNNFLKVGLFVRLFSYYCTFVG